MQRTNGKRVSVSTIARRTIALKRFKDLMNKNAGKLKFVDQG